MTCRAASRNGAACHGRGGVRIVQRGSAMRTFRVAAFVLIFLVPSIALAGGQRPGPRETAAQQRANKVAKDQRRYGANANVRRFKMRTSNGGYLKGIIAEREVGTYARVTEVGRPSAHAGKLRVVSESFTPKTGAATSRTIATRVVQVNGARITESVTRRTSGRDRKTRHSSGSSFAADGDAWGNGKSVREQD